MVVPQDASIFRGPFLKGKGLCTQCSFSTDATLCRLRAHDGNAAGEAIGSPLSSGRAGLATRAWPAILVSFGSPWCNASHFNFSMQPWDLAPFL